MGARAATAVDDLAARRLAALAGGHMRRLEAFRAGLARRFGAVPHFDPFDGGEDARCLLLLETPGPRAGAAGFVSRDNPTATARNITRFCAAAGLDRREMVIWNAVPWVIHEAGARNRAPRAGEVAAGLLLLPGLLDLLPRLGVVVLAGRAAARAVPILREARPGLHLLAMAHPSPVYVNTSPGIAPSLVATLRQAAGLLGERGAAAAGDEPRSAAQRGLVG